MCGIGGVLSHGGPPPERAALERMSDSIAHRGPDDAGMLLDGHVALVNRRLAIIDLSSAGHQPMINEDGTLAITYNGEVFNYRELRDQLVRAGHRSRSRTDTEVILHAYEEWGDACVERFNGQFAFAIWDRARRRLFLARDRYGVKPLYHFTDSERFLFASEIRALLTDPSVPRRVCYPALDEYFTFQNTLGEHTLFEGIRILPPGTIMSVDATTGHTMKRTYWSPQPVRDGPAPDLGFAAEQVRAALELAVERQLVADVPIGSYLSGGLDSSAIAAIARRSLPSLSTFTLGWDMDGVGRKERRFDERAAARAAAFASGTDHHEAVIGHEEMERAVPDVVWHLEELRVGQSYANFAVAAFAKPFVKVVLSGAGGDELFAGYPWRYVSALTATDPDDFVARAYRGWQRLVLDAEKPAFYQDGVTRATEGATARAFRAALEGAGTPLRDRTDFLDASFFFDFSAFLHGLLVVEDKLGMAHGLEVRVPFLDNDLVDLALRLPPSLKLRTAVLLAQSPGGERTSGGKVVLREAVRPILGNAAVDRPKQGFSAPDATWFRGASRPFLERRLRNPRARLYEVVRPDFVRRALEEHWSGTRDRRLLVWSLLAFDEWLRRFEVAT